ncbi:hypothetical protein [Paracoccus sp. (in: a-proteobacteria)]|uniref:glycosyltransferase family protein n=1 Tax=Paracoccus sp. TaxID=267 RepID=UPI003A88520C
MILEWASFLLNRGVDALVFTHLPDYSYRFSGVDMPITYAPAVANQLLRYGWPRTSHRFLSQRVGAFLRAKDRTKIDLRDDDIIMVPEYASDFVPDAFPQNRCVMIAQDVYGLMRVSRQPRFKRNRFSAVITTSEASSAAARLILEIEPWQIPLVVDPTEFSFVADKKPVIAYLPRKLAEDSQLVTSLLAERGRTQGFEIRRLAKLTRAELLRQMHEAAIFLSFSWQEGFGLPPAEAMATGALVIGYTGVGGDEYFVSDVGYPIPGSDLSRFVRTVEQVCEQFLADPDSLLPLRKRASERILSRYSEERRADSLMRVFHEIGNNKWVA